jgi:hypothetical protein
MSSITYSRVFSTLEAATEFVRQVNAAFPAAGYGTYLRITETDDGTWLVTGSRQSSCD